MAENCKKCSKSIGLFSTIEVEGQKYCAECSSAVKADKNIYIPEIDAIHRALSALLTDDSNTKKLFDKGSNTDFLVLRSENFNNLNANLIQSSILLKILEKLERIEQHLEQKS